MVTLGNVPERNIGRLRVGNPTTVRVDAIPEQPFTGRVARIAPVLDAATRSALIEIDIPNPKGELKAEMFARIELDLGATREAYIDSPRQLGLPRSASGRLCSGRLSPGVPVHRDRHDAAGNGRSTLQPRSGDGHRKPGRHHDSGTETASPLPRRSKEPVAAWGRAVQKAAARGTEPAVHPDRADRPAAGKVHQAKLNRTSA